MSMNDVLAINSARSALEFAIECVERTEYRLDELESALSTALKLANRAELQGTILHKMGKLGLDQAL